MSYELITVWEVCQYNDDYTRYMVSHGFYEDMTEAKAIAKNEGYPFTCEARTAIKVRKMEVVAGVKMKFGYEDRIFLLAGKDPKPVELL